MYFTLFISAFAFARRTEASEASFAVKINFASPRLAAVAAASLPTAKRPAFLAIPNKAKQRSIKTPCNSCLLKPNF
jgi:hypothetical protein